MFNWLLGSHLITTSISSTRLYINTATLHQLGQHRETAQACISSRRSPEYQRGTQQYIPSDLKLLDYSTDTTLKSPPPHGEARLRKESNTSLAGQVRLCPPSQSSLDSSPTTRVNSAQTSWLTVPPNSTKVSKITLLLQVLVTIIGQDRQMLNIIYNTLVHYIYSYMSYSNQRTICVYAVTSTYLG